MIRTARVDRLVAATHLLRYADDPRVSPGYRGAGELRWLLHWPGANPALAAVLAADADRLAVAALDRLSDVAGPVHADGAVPGPAGCGVSDL